MFDWHRWFANNDKSSFTSKKAKKARRTPSKAKSARLLLESLEAREMMANDVPTIVAVFPRTGSTVTVAPSQIRVTFSEQMTASATVTSNYLLLDSNGNPVTINSVQLDPSGTVATLNINGNVALDAGRYTLYVMGDKVFDADDNFPLSPSANVLVGSGGTNDVAVVTVADNGIMGSVSTYAQPQVPNPNPFAPPLTALPWDVRLADMNADGLADLVVANGRTDQVNIFLGRPASQGFGFGFTPDRSLALPIVAAGGSTRKSLIVADFDNDRLPDIAVANTGTNQIIYYQNISAAGNPNFASSQSYAAHNTPIAIVAGFFNGDNNLDIAIANSQPSNPLGGTNNSWTIQAMRFNSPTAAQDFILENNFWVIGDNRGSSNPIRGVTDPTYLGVGDLDNNGSDDLIIGASQLVYLRNNSGAGMIDFGDPGLIQNAGLRLNDLNRRQILIDSSIQNVSGIASGDLNADGIDDIVVSATTGGNSFVRVYFNAGTITGTPGNDVMDNQDIIAQRDFTPPAGTNYAGEVSLADMDEDGRLDIVVGSGDLNRLGVSVLINASTPTTPIFNATAQSPLPSNTFAYGVDVGDVDNDGNLDIVVANRGNINNQTNTGNVTLVRGKGDGTFFTSTNTALPAVVSGTASGDVNGDGIFDIVSINNSFTTANSFVSVQLGLGNDQYAAPFQYLAAYTGPNGREEMRDFVNLALADINNDGRLDILVVSQAEDAVGVLLNNTTPTTPLTAASFIPRPRVKVGDAPTDITVANFDRDVRVTNGVRGSMDIAVSHAGTGVAANRGVTMVFGNGDGTFNAATRQEIPFVIGLTSNALASADFNGDGRPDLVIATDINGGPSEVYYLANRVNASGAPTFQLVNAYAMGIVNITDLALADFNNDGFLDVIASSQSRLPGNSGVSVLLNQFGTGFQNALRSPVVPGIAGLQNLAILDFNRDGKKDIVVSAINGDGINNFFSLVGRGNGTFFGPAPYLAVQTPQNFAQTVPAYLAVTTDPVKLVTSFTVGGNKVASDLVSNGDFETRDLSGELSNLTGWTTAKIQDLPGSHGQWTRQSGTFSPTSATSVPLPTDNFRALLDQEHLRPLTPVTQFDVNSREDYAGTNVLYQDIFIPTGLTRLTLSMTLYLQSIAFIPSTGSAWSNPNVNSILDHRTNPDNQPNQQVRVDITDPGAFFVDEFGKKIFYGPFETDEDHGVLVRIFNTSPRDPAEFTETNRVSRTFTAAELAQFAGKTIRLRIAAVNNAGPLLVGADDVTLKAVFTDTSLPTLASVRLRNQGVFKNGIPVTTDSTIIGQIRDNGSINNIQFIEFDTEGNGFNGPDDYKTNVWDAAGNFSFMPPNIRFGDHTVRIRVVDRAGNQSIQTLRFTYQGRSVLDWQAIGPTSVDTTGLGLNFNSVSGRITATVVDPLDPSGNTYFVGSANGGVWKTTNGGESWTPLMDYIIDQNGNAISAPIGGLGAAVRRFFLPNGSLDTSRAPITVLYAGTGPGDDNLGSRRGYGVLKSSNGGASWQLVGNSGSVMAGTRVTKVVVDPNNPDVAYVAVAETADSSRGGVFRTLDGGLTWVNVLTANRMRTGNNGPVFGTAADPLASVTDLIIDPFDSDALYVGLGNVGLVNTNASAGLWRTNNKGEAWARIEGGDRGIAQSNLPFGVGVGRVTVGQGSGRVADQEYLYVLIGTPPGGAPFFGTAPPDIDNGAFAGLYRSTNSGQNFTRVMLKANRPVVNDPNNYIEVALGYGETAYAGAVAVDPANPFIVYVGGARRYDTQHNRAGTGFFEMNHSFIRVDTGNMIAAGSRDHEGNLIGDALGSLFAPAFYGDDRFKALEASRLRPANTPFAHDSYEYYDGTAYEGEGVFFYDLETDTSNDLGFFTAPYLPASLHNLVFDAQGRLLVGTESGIWRGISSGFGYDYTSGSGFSILAPFVGFYTSPGGLELTALNGNLQIGDLTSVDIDPRVNNVFYTTQIGTGTSVSTSLFRWASSGLVNTADGSPNAANIRVAPFSPISPAGTPSTLYRNWEFANPVLQPEVSTDGGFVFNRLNTSGVSVTGNNSRRLPILAVNPRKQLDNGRYFDEVLLGTNQVYYSGTGVSFTPMSAFPGINNGLVTAIGIAPPYDPVGYPNGNPAGNPQFAVYYAGTDSGAFFTTMNRGADGWARRSLGLPIGPITAITVDQKAAGTVYVAVGVGTGARIFRSTNFGQTWTSITGNLPPGTITSLLLDRRYKPVINSVTGKTTLVLVPQLGAPNGKLYVGTNVGVFVSINESGWTRVGSAIPNAPIVDLQHEAGREVLAAASQGRGAFAISTAPITNLGDLIIDEDRSTGPIAFEVNTMGIAPSTSLKVTVYSENTVLVPNSSITLSRGGTVIVNGSIAPASAGGQYTMNIRPTANSSGRARIVVLVEDLTNKVQYSESFFLDVVSVNDAPVLDVNTPIKDQSIPKNSSVTMQIRFTDVDTPTSRETVTVTSDNPTLLPNGSITLTKNASGNYTLRVVPAPDQVGTATITVTINDPNGPPHEANVYPFALQVYDNATLPFSDNFNRLDNAYVGPYWRETHGNMSTLGNRAVVVSTRGIAVVRGIGQKDVQLQARLDLDGSGVQYGGLVARYQGGGTGDQNMFWGALVGVNGVYTAEIWRNLAGKWTLLSRTNVLTGTGLLRFQVFGNNLKLFLNGTLVGNAFDNALPNAGAVGVRGFTLASFDDFLVDRFVPQAQSLPYSDDFNQPNGSQLEGTEWTGRVGNFTINNNQARADLVNSVSVATVNGIRTANADLRIDINLPATGTQFAGLVARYQDNGDHYFGALVASNGSYTAQIYRTRLGVTTLLNSQSVDVPIGNLRFVVYGESLRLFLNDTLVAYANDTSLGAGAIGIRASRGTSLDNFDARAYNLSNPGLPFADTYTQADGTLISDNWYLHAGSFSVTNNQAKSDAPISLATVNNVVQANAAAQITLALPTTGTQIAGVILRYNGSGDRNYYWGALVGVNGVFTAEIYRNVNGTNTQLSRQVLSTGTGTLRFQAVGDSLQLLLDGRLVGSANDRTFATGGVGIRGFKDTNLDNFVASAHNLGNPSLPYADAFAGTEGAPLSSDWYNRAGGFSLQPSAIPGDLRARGDYNINLAVLNNVSAGDVNLQADVDIAGVGVQYAGLVARYGGVGDGNMYWGAVVGVNGAFTAEIWKNVTVNGQSTWTKLRSVAVGTGTGTLQFNVLGSSLTLSFDGQTLLATDTSLTAGGVGIRGNRGATLDNFVAQ